MEQLATRTFAGFDLGSYSVQISIYNEGSEEMTEESLPVNPGSHSDSIETGVAAIAAYMQTNDISWEDFSSVCFTMEDPSEKNRKYLETLLDSDFKKIHDLKILTRFRAFVEYVFHQERVVWDHNTILLDYDGVHLRYVIVEQIRRARQRAYRAVIDEIDLTEYHITADMPDLDTEFGKMMKQFMMKHQAQIVFLTGSGFEGNWMKRTLTYLCAGRRVFLGQNIYANGVCLSGIQSIPVMDEGMLLMQGPDMVYHTIGIVTSDYGRARYIPITSIGREWYNTVGEMDIILDKSHRVDFFYHNTKENEIEGASCEIRDLPKRPPKTTRIHIEIRFSSPTSGVILLTDRGFGSICNGTGKVTVFPFTLVS